MAKARKVRGLAPDVTFERAAALTVAVRAQELFEHTDNVLDLSDIEHVHDMRVATRRLRAALEVFAPCFGAKRHARVLAEVKHLADALGERRDPDVQLGALNELTLRLTAADGPGIAAFAQQVRDERVAGNVVLAEALQHAREVDLEGRLRALTGEPPVLGEPV